MRKKKVSDVIERLHHIFNVTNDSQLSESMNIKRSTIGSWRSRESIPYAECVAVSEAKGISLDWLLTGEGQMYKSRTTPILREESAHYGSSRQLTPREEAVLKMFNSLTEDEKRDIQKSLEEKKRLADIEEKVKHLTKELAEVKKGA